MLMLFGAMKMQALRSHMMVQQQRVQVVWVVVSLLVPLHVVVVRSTGEQRADHDRQIEC